MIVRTSHCKRKKNYGVLKGITIARHHTPTWLVACDFSHVYRLWSSWQGVRLSNALIFHMPKSVFVIFVSAAMLGAILIGFKTSNWCCILTHILFWLNTENNADSYITKPPNLSSTGKCDNEPHDTLFSWFGPILFLLHQRNSIDHSWPLAMDHICKNKKPFLYVHKKN